MKIIGKNGIMIDEDGNILIEDVEVELDVTPPVVEKRSTRWGHGWDYHEITYHCPKCDKMLAYYNGVTLVSGREKKFCDECGQKLWFENGIKRN